VTTVGECASDSSFARCLGIIDAAGGSRGFSHASFQKIRAARPRTAGRAQGPVTSGLEVELTALPGAQRNREHRVTGLVRPLVDLNALFRRYANISA